MTGHDLLLVEGGPGIDDRTRPMGRLRFPSPATSRHRPRRSFAP